MSTTLQLNADEALYSGVAHFVPGYSNSRYVSPDGRFTAFLKHTEIRNVQITAVIHIFESKSRKILGKFEVGLGLNSEMLWSPDSKILAVSSSDAGGNGPYYLNLITVHGGTVQLKDLTPLIYKTFGHPYACAAPESPNVAAIRWLNGSRRLLVAAEVVHHSICDNFGTFVSYEVDLPTLTIVHSYSQLKTKKLFGGSLARELRLAPNECFTKPHSCEMVSNQDQRDSMQASLNHR